MIFYENDKILRQVNELNIFEQLRSRGLLRVKSNRVFFDSRICGFNELDKFSLLQFGITK